MEDNNINKEDKLGTEVKQPDALKNLTAEQLKQIEDTVNDKVFGKGQMPVVGEISAEEAAEKIGGDPNSAILVQNMQPAGDGQMRCEVITKPASQEHVQLHNGQVVPITMSRRARRQLRADVERDMRKGLSIGTSTKRREAMQKSKLKKHRKNKRK